MILAMEHGMNASTFSARVTVSTESDLVSAVTSALGTMKGPLHGGAPSAVTDMLEGIGEKQHAESYIREKLEKGERLMGFGHRVYKTHDPRAKALRVKAEEIAGATGISTLLFMLKIRRSAFWKNTNRGASFIRMSNFTQRLS